MIEAGELVVVRCDNQGVCLKLLNPPSRPPAKRNLRLVYDCAKWIRDLAEAKGFELSIRHVKGHQPESCKDVDAVGNRRADALATSIFLKPAKVKKPPRANPTPSSAARAAKISATVAKLTLGKVQA